ncbi:hypothetical protein EXU57_13300 [Segetibacter sp. 3557_3]|uniref:PepSY-like domain-containing protein n=1 Tax=Segetibacter sp. 3557_3 TaxID=2547429 RepID=UPI001058F478|nr:PepSY-like domain-containing protein [Segetibacter sp. 3557_3]TDH25671.1 hypothetical protein EXU57_13300 [Segetibacter sp. 3557_3]
MNIKAILPTLVLIATFSVANAQFGKIPTEATNAFQKKYPEASNVSWKSRLASYKAEFDMDKQHYTAEFNSKGQWEKTEAKLTYDKLPTEISDGLHKSLYSNWEFTEIMKVDEKEKDTVYRIRVKKTDLDKKYLFFSTKGQLIKESRTI